MLTGVAWSDFFNICFLAGPSEVGLIKKLEKLFVTSSGGKVELGQEVSVSYFAYGSVDDFIYFL